MLTISELLLPKRYESALFDAGLGRIEDLIASSDKKLTRIAGVGEVGLLHIRTQIKEWQRTFAYSDVCMLESYEHHTHVNEDGIHHVYDAELKGEHIAILLNDVPELKGKKYLVTIREVG